MNPVLRQLEGHEGPTLLRAIVASSIACGANIPDEGEEADLVALLRLAGGAANSVIRLRTQAGQYRGELDYPLAEVARLLSMLDREGLSGDALFRSLKAFRTLLMEFIEHGRLAELGHLVTALRSTSERMHWDTAGVRLALGLSVPIMRGTLPRHKRVPLRG